MSTLHNSFRRVSLEGIAPEFSDRRSRARAARARTAFASFVRLLPPQGKYRLPLRFWLACQRAANNAITILRAHPLSLMIFAALQIGDILSTHLALRAGLSESNPIPAGMFGASGEAGMVALKLLTLATFLIVIARLDGRFKTSPWRALAAMNVIMCAVVLSNTAQLL